MSIAPQFKTAVLENDIEIWYREAGDPKKPTLLLLHGYPTSSHMFRHLIPILTPHFHIIAPDLPGFGFTKVPEKFEYNFSNLASAIDLFVGQIGLTKFAIYIFDYGAPVGLRLALSRPDQVTGIIAQNGNAYEEGLADKFWHPIKKYWDNQDKYDPEYVEALTNFVKDPANIKDQYSIGFANPELVEPTAYLLDEALLSRPGQAKIQVSLFYDYQHNLDLYPQFQEFFRTSNVPILVVWGKNDYIFTVEGAEAYKRDSKNVSIKFYNTGHFALEDHVNEIGNDIIEYFGPILKE